jgi:hypothetical protein
MTYADFIMEATDFNSLIDRLEQLVGCPPSPFRRRCGDIIRALNALKDAIINAGGADA